MVRASLIGFGLLAVVGCEPQGQKVTHDAVKPPEAVVEKPVSEIERFSLTAPSAPTAGEASGMGFATGDAAHSGGMGMAFAGYKGIGGHGTNGSITDHHPAEKPDKPMPDPVLPPQ